MSSRFRLALFVLLVSALPGRAAPPDPIYDDAIDSPMYEIPKLTIPPLVLIFPEKAKNLWLRALQRPEADLRCQAADAFAQARRRGFQGMDAAVDPLLAAFDRPEEKPIVRVAIAKALIGLDARKAADRLWRQAQAGNSDLREVVEPALAQWNHQAAREIWLARLREPTTPQRNLVLAIRGLAALHEKQAIARLREMALARHVSGPIRLESARALAMLQSEGLEKDAAHLLADSTPRGLVDRLIAASMLGRHTSAEAIGLLQRLLRDAEPTAIAVAAARLLEIDPVHLMSAMSNLLANADAKVRSLAVEALFRRPDRDHLRRLCDRLDDDNRSVRLLARRFLRELAGDKQWRESVIADAMTVLKGKSWRELEQAAILLAQLDHKAAADRLVELLPFDRPEVQLAAAWGLRKMDVPKTLPRVVRFLRSELERLSAKRNTGPILLLELPPPTIIDFVLSQLNQFVGQRKYAEADSVLRKFIPKGMHQVVQGSESRAAAAWALGRIHEGKGKNEEKLVSALAARLADGHSIPPEDMRVSRMSAIALGQMKAANQLDLLRQYSEDKKETFSVLSHACAWSIANITGKPIPPVKTVERVQRDWFLGPDQ